MGETLQEVRNRLGWCGGVSALLWLLAMWQSPSVLAFLNSPLPASHDHPLTLAVTEPLSSTVRVSLWAAALVSFPVWLYHAYSFSLKRITQREKRELWPYLVGAPLLFVGGVVVSFLFLVPPALDFLLSFNQEEFSIQVRAADYYSFLLTFCLAFGLLSQIPVVVLTLVKLGVVTAEEMARSRKLALVSIAVLAALLPGTDPISMLIALFVMYALFELSLLLARVTDR